MHVKLNVLKRQHISDNLGLSLKKGVLIFNQNAFSLKMIFVNRSLVCVWIFATQQKNDIAGG